MERIPSKKRKARNEKAGIRREFCSEQKTNVGERDNKKGEADKKRGDEILRMLKGVKCGSRAAVKE